MELKNVRCKLIQEYLSSTSFDFERIMLDWNGACICKIIDMDSCSTMTLTQCFESIHIVVDEKEVGWVHKNEKYPEEWSPGFKSF